MLSRNRLIATLLGVALALPAGGAYAQAPAGAPDQPAPTPAAPATQPTTEPAPAQPSNQPRPSDRAWTDEELKEIEEIERDTEIYAGASKDHGDRMKIILRREYEKRLAEINNKYKAGCLRANADFKAKREKSQKLLEDFLVEYPDDSGWTPDVMFRLAKLYYYQLNTEWNERNETPCAALTGAQEITQAPVEGEGDLGSPVLGPDYTPALALWRAIIVRFGTTGQSPPDYRLADGTLYLLAFVTGESPPFGMGRPDDARPIWLGLVCRNHFDPLAPPPPPPKQCKGVRECAAGESCTGGQCLPACPQPDPKFLAVDPYAGCTPYRDGSKLNDEAWVRIGDAHFNARCELPQAIAAYKQVVAKGEAGEYYDNALYMLAWGYYRFNQYDDAILTFDKFVKLSDKMEEEGQGQFDLRKEAVQYLAISFADPRAGEALSNPVKAMERINAFYKGREQEKHVRDVYEELGNVIKTNAGTPAGDGPLPDDIYVAYSKAIEAWRFCLDNFPLHPRNPEIHQAIVDLLELMGDKTQEVQERQKIAELYKKGSPWYRANEMNRDAMDAANRLSENSLIKAAVSVHRRAQEERLAWEQGKTDEQLLTMQDDPGRKAYQELYRQAAQLYDQYLISFPTSTNLYEFTYRMADCYFYADDFDKAVLNYQWVRDNGNMGTKYKGNSIKRIIESRRTAVDLAMKHSPPTLVEPPDPTKESLAAKSDPIPVPELWAKLQAGMDEYAKWVPNDPDASKLALEAAIISYKHLQLDDALVRFEDVFKRFCHTPEAVQAKDGLLVIYQSRNQDDKFEKTNQKFIQLKCGTEDEIAKADEQNKALAYKKAREKFLAAEAKEKSGENAQQEFLDAGQAFYGYYMSVKAANPDRDDALFAAAVAYSRAGRPKTAISLYQVFLDNKDFRDSEYYVEAVYLIAQNLKNAFEYEKAADKFMEVYVMAGQKGRKAQKSFDLAQARLDSLYNAAYFREVDRTYFDRSAKDKGAISLYKQYAKEEPDQRKASDGYFRIALIYKKVGKDRDMLDTYATWKKTYAKDPTIAATVCQNYVMTFYDAARLQKKVKEAKKGWTDTIAAYDRCFNDSVAARQKTPKDKDDYTRADIIAREWAGEAQFRLADYFYKEKFEPFKFKWPKLDVKDGNKLNAALEKAFKGLGDIHEATIREFLKVGRFTSTWGLAALVRIGDTSYFAADKLYAAGMPKEIEKLDLKYPDLGLVANFQDTIETIGRENYVDPADEKKAPFGAKKYWVMTLETAKKVGISNEWSKLAEQRLNTYIASDLYPVQRDDITDAEVNP